VGFCPAVLFIAVKKEIIMFKKLAVLAMAMVLFSAPSFATELRFCTQGPCDENTWLTNMWDKRSIDESLPNGGRVGSPGGWFMSLSGPESSLGEVGRVEFIGSKRTIILGQGYPYHWLGSDDIGFNIWFGNITEADDSYVMQCYDKSGNLMDLVLNGSPIGTAYGPIEPHIDLPAVPFVTVKRMRVRKNDLMVKVAVPDDPAGRDIHLRLRIYEGQGTDRMIREIRYYPPFEIVKKDGTVIPNKAKLSVPSEYAGSFARFEYRASNYNSDPILPMARTVTWLTLPGEYTPPAQGLARCFTIEGTIDNRVNSMGSAWDGSTLFAQNGLDVGTPVSYKICVNEEGDPIADLRAYPAVGGNSSQCDPNYGVPVDYMNSILYDAPPDPETGVDPEIGIVAVGTCDEYVQVQFPEDQPPSTWAEGNTFRAVHSAHQELSAQNSEWYSRIWFDGSITAIEPY